MSVFHKLMSLNFLENKKKKNGRYRKMAHSTIFSTFVIRQICVSCNDLYCNRYKGFARKTDLKRFRM